MKEAQVAQERAAEAEDRLASASKAKDTIGAVSEKAMQEKEAEVFKLSMRIEE